MKVIRGSFELQTVKKPPAGWISRNVFPRFRTNTMKLVLQSTDKYYIRALVPTFPVTNYIALNI